jgi:hypothetical protein
VREGDVVVCNVVEEMDFVSVEQKTCGDRVHGSITPSLVEEATIFVEGVKEVEVSL